VLNKKGDGFTRWEKVGGSPWDILSFGKNQPPAKGDREKERKRYSSRDFVHAPRRKNTLSIQERRELGETQIEGMSREWSKHLQKKGKLDYPDERSMHWIREAT